MTLILFAAALFAAAPPDLPPPEPSMTTAQLYDGCVRYVAYASASRDALDEAAATCAVKAAVIFALGAVETATRDADPSQPDTRTFCVPESVLQRTDDSEALAVVRVFISYVDHNPASRGADADETMDHALAEKWPCPR